MASNACFATFAAAEDLLIIHYYGMEILTMAKKILISALLVKADKMDVEEFLRATFTSKKLVILAPCYGGNAFSLEDISFEDLEEILVFKPPSEPAPIVGSHNLEEYNTLRLAHNSANGEGRASSLENLRDFAFKAVMENLAASIHKEFASYFDPVQKQQLLLLGNRKVYSTEKAKIQKYQQNRNKEEAARKKGEARAALPSTSTKQPAKDQILPPNTEVPLRSSSAKPKQKDNSNTKISRKSESAGKRKVSKEVNYREESGESSSSVEYPREGKHTDDESEGRVSISGNRTPIFLQQQELFPAFMTASSTAPLTPESLPNYQPRISKHKKRASKHATRSESPSGDKYNAKPSSTREKNKLEKKKSSTHSKKSSKKLAKKSRKLSSSSSSSVSCSDSEQSQTDQVSISFYFYSLFPILLLIHNLLLNPGSHKYLIKL